MIMIMKIIAVLLVTLAAKLTYAVDLDCETAITCPCGIRRVNVTVCVSNANIHEDVCDSLLECENCDEGLCSRCPKGLDGPFCSQEIHKSRQKRQYRRTWRRSPSIYSSCPNMDSPKLGSIRCFTSNDLQTCTGKCLPGYRFTNSPEDEMVLTCRGGQWSPRSSFPDCKSGGHCDLIVAGSGSFNCTTGMDGTRCDVRCSGIYAGRFFCYPGRNWEPPLPRCVKPKPHVGGMNARQPACVCNDGETCNSRGQCMPKGCPDGWTRAQCEQALAPKKKSCPDPGFIWNGFRQNTDGTDASGIRNFEEGQSVVYGCVSDDYELKGSFILTCKTDGTWSRSKPSCIKPAVVDPKLVCPDPGQIANANRLNTDGTTSRGVRPAGSPEYPVGHSVVYTCVPGFALERRSLITCLASGRWSYRTPYCRRITPPAPPPVITTTTTTTTTEKPIPDIKWCRDPGVASYGIREPSTATDRRGFPAGAQLTYSCRDGYDLVGTKEIFCLLQGWWSADAPRCVSKPQSEQRTPEIAYCEYPGDLPNGRVYHIPTLNERRRPSDDREDFYPEGSQIQYSCNDGFSLDGPSTVTCQRTARWSAPQPTCEPVEIDEFSCLNPGPISNGQFVYRNAPSSRNRPPPRPIKVSDPEFPVGVSLRFSCHNGYTLVGRRSLVCLESGSWSADPPVCRRETSRPVYCNYPGDFGNGEVTHHPPPKERRRPIAAGEQYPVGSHLDYSCQSGFTLEGTNHLECLEGGTWSASPPTCISEDPGDIQYCENPGPIQNGRMEYFPPQTNEAGRSPDYGADEHPEGSMVVYNCDEGYRLVGRGTLTCQSTGFWSAKEPVCEQDCGRSFMQTTNRVLNGFNTTSGDWPWVVSISLDDNKSSPFICGGAVINAHTVMTAAHCLERNQPLLLRFGKHHFNVQDDDKQVLTIRSSKTLIHPNYSNRTLDSDIGLITFQKRIRYSHRVQPICLPTRESTFQNIEPGQVGYDLSSITYKECLRAEFVVITGQPLLTKDTLIQKRYAIGEQSPTCDIDTFSPKVGGWGETEKMVPPDKMMLASLPVVSDQECMDAYREQNLRVTQNMFCAGYEDARQSVCGGDSGSPFVFYDRRTERYTLEGLVSFGVRGQCGVAGKYAIFTKVFNFLHWIMKNSK